MSRAQTNVSTLQQEKWVKNSQKQKSLYRTPRLDRTAPDIQNQRLQLSVTRIVRPKWCNAILGKERNIYEEHGSRKTRAKVIKRQKNEWTIKSQSFIRHEKAICSNPWRANSHIALKIYHKPSIDLYCKWVGGGQMTYVNLRNNIVANQQH